MWRTIRHDKIFNSEEIWLFLRVHETVGDGLRKYKKGENFSKTQLISNQANLQHFTKHDEVATRLVRGHVGHESIRPWYANGGREKPQIDKTTNKDNQALGIILAAQLSSDRCNGPEENI